MSASWSFVMSSGHLLGPRLAIPRRQRPLIASPLPLMHDVTGKSEASPRARIDKPSWHYGAADGTMQGEAWNQPGPIVSRIRGACFNRAGAVAMADGRGS